MLKYRHVSVAKSDIMMFKVQAYRHIYQLYIYIFYASVIFITYTSIRQDVNKDTVVKVATMFFFNREVKYMCIEITLSITFVLFDSFMSFIIYMEIGR